MISGLPNVGNSCYANSLIQCLRKCYSNNHLEIPKEMLSGNQEDTCDLYYKYVEKCLTDEQRDKLMVYFKDGTSSPLIIISDNFTNNMNSIHSIGDIICLYRNPAPIDIRECGKLQIGAHYFQLMAFVSYVPGHYYACVEHENKWILCNDDNIYYMQSPHHNAYMLFYIIIDPKLIPTK